MPKFKSEGDEADWLLAIIRKRTFLDFGRPSGAAW
jgi:hypothetical protein